MLTVTGISAVFFRFQGVSLGKFVPIEVIIDTLLANKNADIEKLRQQLDELQQLLDMYEKLDLTEDQKRQLAGMVRPKSEVIEFFYILF